MCVVNLSPVQSQELPEQPTGNSSLAGITEEYFLQRNAARRRRRSWHGDHGHGSKALRRCWRSNNLLSPLRELHLKGPDGQRRALLRFLPSQPARALLPRIIDDKRVQAL